jgi:hypothetical protein
MNAMLLIFPLPLRERVPRRGGRGASIAYCAAGLAPSMAACTEPVVIGW